MRILKKPKAFCDSNFYPQPVYVFVNLFYPMYRVTQITKTKFLFFFRCIIPFGERTTNCMKPIKYSTTYNIWSIER